MHWERSKSRRFGAALTALVFFGACSGSGGNSDATDTSTPSTSALSVSKASTLGSDGGVNPTVVADPETSDVYMAWAEELKASAGEEAALRAVVARSDDGGKTFGEPVAASASGDRVTSSTVAPTQVAVGPKGVVYLLYGHTTPDVDPQIYERGKNALRIVRSEDGGKSFGTPVDLAPDESEETTMSMSNLLVGRDGDVYVSWLDDRELIAHAKDTAGKPAAGGHSHEEAPPTQLRMARSDDEGRSFSESVLVKKPVCATCGTQMAQRADGLLLITTRSEETPKGSYDAVRDVFVSTSSDEGSTWSKDKKIHDDAFKVSVCPGITSGLAVGDDGRIHAAWYTGTERGSGPGVYYAVSDDAGKTFSKPVALLRDTWVPYSDVKLVVGDGGDAWVAFEDRRGSKDLVTVARVGSRGDPELAKGWPGSAPDIAAIGSDALLTWSTAANEDDDETAEHAAHQDHDSGAAVRSLIVSGEG